ncbi:MAG TPA: hypothetical protein VK486_02500 [Thermoleophilaceae bacterium]|nr:hypothetical protein [Thermoleophilaceae bacterium]
MLRRSLLLSALSTVVLAGSPPVVSAAGWKAVTTPDQTSVHQVGLVRSPDGVLHLVWHHPTGPNTEDLLHTSIAGNGRIGSTNPIQSGWTGFQNAALVLDPQGIRMFVGAMRSTDSSDPNDELSTALSTDGGASWSLQPGNVVPDGGQAYGSPVAATTLPNGVTLQTWAGTLGTWAHSGLSPATPNHDFQAPLGNYGYYPNLATDAAARTLLAWYSSAAGHLGVLAQDVAADGSPIGSAVTMPGTSDMAIGMLGLTPLVARTGGGFYVAYPTGYPSMNRVRVWRVGASSAPTIARLGSGGHPVALAAASGGRLWAVWADTRGGAARVLARRSNEKATRFGAVVDAGRAAGAPSTYQLGASPVGNALDVLANFNIGTQPHSATYYRRILPGLTLSAKPSRLPRRGRHKVVFHATDAGDSVRGVRVTAGGASGVTRPNGAVTLRLPGHAVKARATKTGYTPAALRLRVK